MDEVQALIDRARAAGVVLRLGLAAEDGKPLPEHLRHEITSNKAGILAHLALALIAGDGQAAILPKTDPKAPGRLPLVRWPTRLRKRARSWGPVTDEPAWGDCCADCFGQRFGETAEGWECVRCCDTPRGFPELRIVHCDMEGE